MCTEQQRQEGPVGLLASEADQSVNFRFSESVSRKKKERGGRRKLLISISRWSQEKERIHLEQWFSTFPTL